MSKALSRICLVLLVCFGSAAWADKPKLAILGLEVAPGPGGVVDPATTQVAKDITKELRSRAQSGASQYVVAPNSNKELTDEKLLMSCDNEAKDCMAVIGTGLQADMLLYGRVERKGDLYKVQLKLLDVKNKTIESGGDEMLVGAAPVGLSRRLYTKMIGDTPAGVAPGPPGSLLVAARAQGGAPIEGGRVLVDEERKGELAGGRLTVAGVPEGRHVVAIETGGFRRYEETVTVRGGQPLKLDAVLVEREAGAVADTGSASHATAWKIALGASIAVTVAGFGWSGFSVVKRNSDRDDIKAVGALDSTTVDDGDCGKSDDQIKIDHKLNSFNASALHSACKWNDRIPYGFVAGGVGAIATAVSVFMLVRDRGAEKSPSAARDRQPAVAIAPLWSPTTAGAELSVRW